MRGTQKINKMGHLEIGGVDVTSLTKEHSTPLYVYDVTQIKEKIHAFKQSFEKHQSVTSRIIYASKAFSSLAMLELVTQQGLSVDVVSGGEMYAALEAGCLPENIIFHGNNKSWEELSYALESEIGTVVVDNLNDVDLLMELTELHEKSMDILLRITPGVEAHTHDYIMTGQEDSKFGFNLSSDDLSQAFNLIKSSSSIRYKGLHCHIGSQIFETEGFERALEKVFNYISELDRMEGCQTSVLNTGGGFGIKYTADDQPLPVDHYVEAIIGKIVSECEERRLSLPEIWIEPGRSIIGEAGTTLYSVGALKNIPSTRRYISVDGGMSDNIRPALYQAKYEAVLANRMDDVPDDRFTVAGKCCESGDILINEISLPNPSRGDILAVFSTGAYGYSMASHYNRLPKPAVVFVEDGKADLVVRRESYADLMRNEQRLSEKATAAV